MDREHPVQLALVGSLPRRKEGLDPGMIIFDEVHHISAPSWRKIANDYPTAKRLGLTATPSRLDRRPLTPTFTAIVNGPPVRSLISDGYLAEFQYFAPSRPDLKNVKDKLGDYDRVQLAKVMSGRFITGDAIEHFITHARNRTAIAFTVDVDSSKLLVERFIAAGVPALHVDAGTPYDERAKALEDLAAGRVRVLSNCELFTEGLDLPAIDAVILLRPTHSKALFQQMAGRTMRPSGSVAMIFDHAGLCYEHALPDAHIEWRLDGAAPVRKGSNRLRKCPECACVHEIGPECPSCGSVYPKISRDVEVIDGTLVVVRDATYSARKEMIPRPILPVPPGMMTIEQYARHCDGRVMVG